MFVAVPVGVGVETLVAVGDGDGVGVLLGTTVAVGVAVPGLGDVVGEFVAVPVGVGVELGVGVTDGVTVAVGVTVGVEVGTGFPLPGAESARNIAAYALKGNSGLADWARTCWASTMGLCGTSSTIWSLGMRTICPWIFRISAKSGSAASEADSADDVVTLSVIAPPPRSKPAISTRNGIGLFTSAPRC